jgi:diguanylate cyclase (GGDEF)-like protein
MLSSRASFPLIVLSALLFIMYSVAALMGLQTLSDFLSPFIFLFCAWHLLRAFALAKSYRLSWLFLAFALLSNGFGEAVWAVLAHVVHIDPAESVPLMYLYLGMNVGILATSLYLAFNNRKRWTSFQFLVDALALFVVILGFVYFIFFNDRFLALFQFDHEAISAFLYLTADMLILTFIASIYLSLNRNKKLFFFTIECVGILLFIIADCFYVYAVFHDSFIPNTFIDVGYCLAATVIGIGALFYARSPYDPQAYGSDFDSTRGIVNRALVLTLIPVLTFFIGKLIIEEAVFFATVIIIHQLISLIVRKLIARENALMEKSRQAEYLEAVVADRTRELRIMNQTLENLLRRDAITGLFNRKYFIEIVEQWIQGANADEQVWMMIIDFDRFKSINDTYGHDVGDQVLRLVGKRIETLADARTMIGRLGGDEFGVACLRSSDESIQPLIRSISELSVSPVPVGQFSISIGMSIGVAVWPSDAKTRSDLMRHADIAMYIAKERRINGVSFFDSSLNAIVERGNQIDMALKNADITKEFSVVYQPQISIGTRRLVGMEALVRWKSPTLGPVPPDEFISIAEENGIILPLSDWIIAQAFTRIAEWNSRYNLDLLMGVNISPLQLDEADFIERIESALDTHGVKPEWVNLELTERCAMKSESSIVRIFDRLAALNISSSIDDFGTGYSSMSYLKKFDIDYIKIAKQLVDGIAVNETDAQIVQAIIMMASALNLRTIAEGVEDEAQFRLLESLGCDEIQGYYFGKPVPPDEFERLFLIADAADLLDE